MLKNTKLPFDLEKARQIAEEFGTPIYIYDEAGIRRTARSLLKAFNWSNGYKNFFAVKAAPTPAILKVLHNEGMGFDCSSRSELIIMKRMGFSGEDIFYTSNNTPKEDFELAIELNAIVNVDDLSQVPAFIEALAGRKLSKAALRYNPGSLKQGNSIMGQPAEAKFGMSLPSLIEAAKQLNQQQIGELGLHTMVVSNEMKPEYFRETAEVLLDAVRGVEKEAGVTFDFINLGGGFGLNYQPDQAPFDIERAAQLIRTVFKNRGQRIRLFTENGRFVTGPHGYLLTRVRYVMHKHKTFIGLDSSMHNLMRPGIYGAYHHISVLGRENESATNTYDLVGSLCENNDKFAVDRQLPEVEAGDLIVIHDAGAHGHAMGFNYNGMLRSGEVLLKDAGDTQLIRKAETVDDYLRNVIWP